MDEGLETEPNDGPETATPLAVPGAVSGRFERPGDRDWLRVAAKKGDKLQFRALARAAGSPSWLLLRLRRAGGGVIAESDVSEAGDGAIAHRFDADGEHFLVVEEATFAGGPGHAWRVEAAIDRPDFGLQAGGDSAFGAGGAATIEVSCDRKSFSGPIRIVPEHAVDGLVVAAAEIPEGKDKAAVSVALAEGAGGGLRELRLAGIATIDGVEVRQAVSTSAALRKLYPRLDPLPPGFDGSIGVGLRRQ